MSSLTICAPVIIAFLFLKHVRVAPVKKTPKVTKSRARIYRKFKIVVAPDCSNVHMYCDAEYCRVEEALSKPYIPSWRWDDGMRLTC